LWMSREKVLDMFHADKSLYGANPVINDKGRPVGIVVRQNITEFFSKRFVKEQKAFV
jgi:hypothetical protein